MTDSIAIRLTPTQMSHILQGLRTLAKAYGLWRDKKRGYSYPFALCPPPYGFDRGTYDPTMMAQVVGTWNRLRRKIAGGRVRLNSLELRIAAFAVRIQLEERRLLKHHARTWDVQTKCRFAVDEKSIRKLRRTSSRTITSLERHTKRADRALRKQIPDQQFRGAMECWRRHLRWMRLNLVYFRPSRPIVRMKKRQQRNLDLLMDIARRGLRYQEVEAPDDAELRRIMRLYLRSSRRGHQGRNSLPEILRYPAHFESAWHLAKFVLSRIDLKRIP